MGEVDNSLIVEMRQSIRADIREMKEDIHHLTIRQTVVEGHLANIMVSLQLVNERIDALATDMRMVKRRLDLVEA